MASYKLWIATLTWKRSHFSCFSGFDLCTGNSFLHCSFHLSQWFWFWLSCWTRYGTAL